MEINQYVFKYKMFWNNVQIHLIKHLVHVPIKIKIIYF